MLKGLDQGLDQGHGQTSIRRTRLMLEPGTEAPDFTATDQNGETVTLSDLRGSYVLLWWYPKAATPG